MEGKAVAATADDGAVKDDTQGLLEVRRATIFKVFGCPHSKEPIVDPNNLDIAKRMASSAREYYKKSPNLLPPDTNSYERVEATYIAEVSRLDKDGNTHRFVESLHAARCILNGNTRTMFCQVVPLALFAILASYLVLLSSNLSGTNTDAAVAGTWQIVLRDVAADVGLAVSALTLGVGVIAFTYRFLYSRSQRDSMQSLDAFVFDEFSRLHLNFRAAQHGAQAEMRYRKHENVDQAASDWTLAYHWLGVRQFLEELIVRNMAFQIRRNAMLYRAFGIITCLGIALICALGVLLWTHWTGRVEQIGLLLAPGMALAFLSIAYGMAMPTPFAIIMSGLRTEGWPRFGTLGIDTVVAAQVSDAVEQLSQAKKIEMNRDRLA